MTCLCWHSELVRSRTTQITLGSSAADLVLSWQRHARRYVIDVDNRQFVNAIPDSQSKIQTLIETVRRIAIACSITRRNVQNQCDSKISAQDTLLAESKRQGKMTQTWTFSIISRALYHSATLTPLGQQ